MKTHALVALLIFCTHTQAAELPIVKPETVGVSAQRLEQITAFTKRNIAEGKHVGIVTMVARHGKIVHFEAAGQYGLDMVFC